MWGHPLLDLRAMGSRAFMGRPVPFAPGTAPAGARPIPLAGSARPASAPALFFATPGRRRMGQSRMEEALGISEGELLRAKGHLERLLEREDDLADLVGEEKARAAQDEALASFEDARRAYHEALLALEGEGTDGT